MLAHTSWRCRIIPAEANILIVRTALLQHPTHGYVHTKYVITKQSECKYKKIRKDYAVIMCVAFSKTSPSKDVFINIDSYTYLLGINIQQSNMIFKQSNNEK